MVPEFANQNGLPNAFGTSRNSLNEDERRTENSVGK